MIYKFINRKHELNHLEKEYSSEGAKFIVIYGRRRVGKTRLIEEFVKNKDYLYYLAAQESDRQQINEFKTFLAKKLNDEFLATNNFDTWKMLFSYLKKTWPKERRIILAIDEVTFIIKSNSAFTSYLQDFWDSFLSHTNTFLILSGSLVGLMMKDVLSNDSPLYGRRTSQLFLEPFTFKDARKFMYNKSFEDSINLYAIIGGVAKYLLFVSNKQPFKNFIEDYFVTKEGFFYREGLFILSQEFKEPSTYVDIFKAIAFGNTNMAEIASFTGLDSKKLSSYLDILITLGLVKKIVPITEKETKFRGAIYEIHDYFLTFWHRFIYPNRSRIEMRKVSAVMHDIMAQLPAYTGRKFETICIQFLQHINSTNQFPFIFKKIGKWWGNYRDENNERKTAEIDIVALNSSTNEVLFAECKWQSKPVDINVLTDLEKKSKLVQWNQNQRKEYFALFSKNGFTKGCTSYCKKYNILLFDLKDLKKIF